MRQGYQKGTGPGDKRPMLKSKIALLKIDAIILGSLLPSDKEAAKVG